MDYDMPIMNGAQATREILKLKDVPIVGCSADGHGKVKKECMDAGMKDVFMKPLFKEALS